MSPNTLFEFSFIRKNLTFMQGNNFLDAKIKRLAGGSVSKGCYLKLDAKSQLF